ncbi:rCG44340 [Rattus norvegicus]|uniref:RCG44340 n=1 Tax=Rattus norvegicus TaxID=10116 RepID=A6KDA0_RAT|nr:rCG44340 [Rattus norvegicus]
MQLVIYFPVASCQNSLKWEMNASFVLSMGSSTQWLQKQLLVLWVKNRRFLWSRSVVGTANKVFPQSKVFQPTTEHGCS